MKKTGTESNKTYGQTIGIRYYLEKKVKPRPYHWQGQELKAYPLYIQITVRRQTAQMKSVIGQFLPPEHLETFLKDNAEAISNEVESIKEKILLSKPFENENFNLKHALSDYSAMQEDIRLIVGRYLRDEYREAFLADIAARLKSDFDFALPELKVGLVDTNDTTEQEHEIARQSREVYYRGKVSEDIHPLLVYNEVFIHAIPENPNILALWNRYDQALWKLRRYCDQIQLQAGRPIITLDDFLFGRFDELFITYWKSHGELKNLHDSFKLLSDNNLPLKELVMARSS